VRPDQTFRGYAGQIASGSIRPGDTVVVFPSLLRSRVKSIETFDGTMEEAVAPMSVTLTLEDERDISRGDMIASAQRVPELGRQFDASVVWLNEKPLDLTRTYLLKHTTQTMPAEITAVRHRVNITTLEREAADQLEMNGIGVLRIQTNRPIYFDTYTDNRSTGSFILIDAATNATVGAGIILAAVPMEGARVESAPAEVRLDRVTPIDRMVRYRHAAATVPLCNRMELAWLLERKLFERGAAVTVVDSTANIQALERAGLLVLLVSSKEPDWELPGDDKQAATRVIERLEESGVLLPQGSLTGGEGI